MNGFNVPLKQPIPVPTSKHSYLPPDALLPAYMDIENLMLTSEFPAPLPTKYDGNLPQPMSMKYAELCSVPKSSQYPELYMGPCQYDEALYPVDTPNVIPNLGPAADFKQQAEVESNASSKCGSGSEMDYQFSDTDDLDLCSLLALPAPANKETFTQDPFNQYGFQPSLEELGLLDPAVLDSSMLDGIHYWNGFQKDSDNDHPNQAVSDPVIAGSYGFPVENKSENAFHTLESILLLEGSQAMSPVNSVMSEDSMVPSSSPAKWEKGLRDLFEQTFDMSDIEGDYMIPPPNKRQEAPSNSQYWALDKKPNLSPPSPPPSPVKPLVASPLQTEPMSSSPAPQEHDSVKHKGKNKPKPTLLFGKHEGEIIRKLLVTNDNARSKPITRDKLITIPVEEFNQLLEEAQLTEIEVAFMKEWRRRGKNKAAAQVARKRKREEVSGLDKEVEKMRQQKVELENKYDHLRSFVESLKERSMAAEDRLFQEQSENLMEPVSRNTHLIHVTDDDKLLLIPKISSKILVMNS